MIEANQLEPPRRMPQEASEWSRRWSVATFVNAYCQIRDCLAYRPETVLIVGVGRGLEAMILPQKFGIKTVTLDIDPCFNPDYVGSVHQMPMFEDQQFDVVIASHVLEHFRFSLVDQALSEIARVAKHALIYLPYGGRHHEIKLTLAQRRREHSLRFSLPPLRKWNISGETPDLQAGAHYWECGYRRFRVKKVRSLLEKHFIIDRMYQNPEWKFSLNFQLTSRRVSDWTPGREFADYQGCEFFLPEREKE